MPSRLKDLRLRFPYDDQDFREKYTPGHVSPSSLKYTGDESKGPRAANASLKNNHPVFIFPHHDSDGSGLSSGTSMDAAWFFDHRLSGFSLLLGPPSWTRHSRRIASDAAPRRHRRRRTASDRRQRPRPSCQSIRSSSRHNSRRIRRRASPTLSPSLCRPI